MSKAEDIRAKVYCNLGRLIEGQYADSYAQGAGLIKTRGSCKLAGVYTIKPGQRIKFAYYRNGMLHQMPKYLLVISSTPNPQTRITDVTFGCPLTLAAELRMSAVRSRFDPPTQADRSSREIDAALARLWTGQVFSSASGSYASVSSTLGGSIPTAERPLSPMPNLNVILPAYNEEPSIHVVDEPEPIPGKRTPPPAILTTGPKIPEGDPPDPDPDPEYNLPDLPPLDLLIMANAVYTQSSLYAWTGGLAATHRAIVAASNANMTDRKTFGIATITQFSGTPEWIKMDLGAAYIVDRVSIGNVGYSWPAITGDPVYLDGVLDNQQMTLVACSLEYSLDNTTWTTAIPNIGPYPWGVGRLKHHPVSFLARYIRVASDASCVAVSEFKAQTSSYYVSARWHEDGSNIVLQADNRIAKPLDVASPIVRTRTRKAVGAWYTELVGRLGMEYSSAPGVPEEEKVWWGLATSATYGPGLSGSGGVGFTPGSMRMDITPNASGAIGWYNDGDTLMLAVDFGSKRIWVGRNGEWFNKGNPSTGKNPLIQGWSGRPKWYITCALVYGLNSERSSVGLPLPTGGYGDGPFTPSDLRSNHYRAVGLQYKAPYGYQVWDD